MLEDFNIVEQCRRYRVGIWACPHFLFILMGIIIVLAIIATNITAQQYADPELATLIVLAVTGVLFFISHIILQSFERMAEAARAKAEFVSIVSHQLRSPLASMKWQLELLLKNRDLDGKTRSYVEDINEYNKRMIKLVNDLLAVSRIENSRLVLAPASLSLLSITKQVLKDYEIFANSSNITLKLIAPHTLPAVVADEVHIRWVMENLLNNAIRYSNPKTVVTITMAKKNKNLLWSIENWGEPIPPEDKKHIFQKFFRAQTSLRLRTEGSGIGLFIAKAVVEALKGIMGFSSQKNGRITFWFSLPLAQKNTLPTNKKT